MQHQWSWMSPNRIIQVLKFCQKFFCWNTPFDFFISLVMVIILSYKPLHDFAFPTLDAGSSQAAALPYHSRTSRTGHLGLFGLLWSSKHFVTNNIWQPNPKQGNRVLETTPNDLRQLAIIFHNERDFESPAMARMVAKISKASALGSTYQVQGWENLVFAQLRTVCPL